MAGNHDEASHSPDWDTLAALDNLAKCVNDVRADLAGAVDALAFLLGAGQGLTARESDDLAAFAATVDILQTSLRRSQAAQLSLVLFRTAQARSQARSEVVIQTDSTLDTSTTREREQ